MSNYIDNILFTIEENMKARDFKGIKICTVKSISPLLFEYKGILIGTNEGDTVYVHPLFIGEKIAFDENTVDELQHFTNSTAYNSPQFDSKITGTLIEFIKNFYNFYKSWQSIYTLNEGDCVILYDLGQNTFIVLQKVIKDTLENKENK